MRWFIACLGVCWLAAGPSRADEVPRLASEETPFERAVREAMDQRLSAAYDQVLLADLIARFEQVTAVQFQFDRIALVDAGVSPENTIVSLHVNNVGIRTALRLVLDQLELTWMIRGDVVLITTRSEAENTVTTKVYDVEDLVVQGGIGSFADLIEVVTTSLASDSWDEVGGPGTPECRDIAPALISQRPHGRCCERTNENQLELRRHSCRDELCISD